MTQVISNFLEQEKITELRDFDKKTIEDCFAKNNALNLNRFELRTYALVDAKKALAVKHTSNYSIAIYKYVNALLENIESKESDIDYKLV
jgi:hypothetical protein